MASKPTSSTPEKRGAKRPKLDSETSISDLDLSPISDRDRYDDNISITENNGIDSSYAVFPSFTTEGDHHSSEFASHADVYVDRGDLSMDTACSSDSEEAFFPSYNESLKSDQHTHDSDSSQEQDSGANVSRTTTEAMIVSAREKDLNIIAPFLITPCCTQQCLQNLTANEVLKLYVSFKSLNPVQQRQWLIDKLNENTSFSGEKSETTYTVSGKAVCITAWCKVLQVSPKRVFSALKVVKEGQMSLLEHGNKGKKRPTLKTEDARAWMERYFNLLGDHMPHIDQIHLPSWDSQKFVYQRYKDDMLLEGYEDDNLISLRTFYRQWGEEFPKVVIPEENRFAKCDICVKVKMEKKGTVDKKIQSELRSKLETHLERVKKERQKYHRHREKSRATPDKSITIIIDGMDQAKTNLPNTKAISKSTSALWRLRTHITGALLHTKSPCGKLAFVFIDLLQWPHDSNLTITVLVNVLLEYSKDHSLPETLHIQLDNTSRENKNRYVLGFCGALVELKVFKKVRVNFLPVGHTHEDVDQMFSKISEEIRKNGSESIPDLMKVITNSSTPAPKTALLEGLWDYKSWVEPSLNPIKNHSKYLCFRFTLNSCGKAELHYKRFSDMPWKPEKDGSEILKGCPDVKTPPAFVVPSAAKLDLERLLRDLPKYKQWINARSWESWEEFIANTEKLTEINPLPWKFLQLKANAEAAERVRKQQPPCTLTQETASIIEKETAAIPEIEVGKKSRSAPPNASKERAPDVRTCTAETSSIPAIGQYIALSCNSYKEYIPQIAKLKKIDDGNGVIEVEWLHGTYHGNWILWKARGKVITEILPLRSILHSPVSLTKSMRLKTTDIPILKQKYATAEFV